MEKKRKSWPLKSSVKPWINFTTMQKSTERLHHIKKQSPGPVVQTILRHHSQPVRINPAYYGSQGWWVGAGQTAGVGGWQSFSKGGSCSSSQLTNFPFFWGFVLPIQKWRLCLNLPKLQFKYQLTWFSSHNLLHSNSPKSQRKEQNNLTLKVHYYKKQNWTTSTQYCTKSWTK